MKNVAIVVHKYLPQPDDDLIFFLKRKGNYNLFHIKHSFPDSVNRQSILNLYLGSKKKKVTKTLDYKFLPEVLVYFKELFFTIKWLIPIKGKIDTYVGMDGLCTLFGLVLKRLGFCKKVVYWCMDFVPLNRFEYNYKNFIYNKINAYSSKNADEVWDISPRIETGRGRYLNISKESYKVHKVVPYGVWNNQIDKVSYKNSQKHTLVFMGHLLKKQGVDMVIKKIPDIIKEIPDFKFKIIGDGNYKAQLIRLANVLEVDKYCKFLGRIDDYSLDKEISKASVAIAPYFINKDSYTYYADPGKVKRYLACGIPVLLTNLPWNAEEILKKECGLIINDDGNNLIEKLLYILKPKINEKFRKNTIKYAKSFDYEKLFQKLDI